MKLIGKFTFDSAHHIEDTKHLLTKKCAEPHGHTYHLTVKFELAMLKEFYSRDFVDFQLIKDTMEVIIFKYDHRDVSKHWSLHTAEQIAQDIKNGLMARYKCNPNDITIELFETDKWGIEC